MTHHAPIRQALTAPNADTAPCYASDLTALIREHQPEAWFFGHTHESCDVMIGETRVANVSVGYPPYPGRSTDDRPQEAGKQVRAGLVRLTCHRLISAV